MQLLETRERNLASACMLLLETHERKLALACMQLDIVKTKVWPMTSTALFMPSVDQVLIIVDTRRVHANHLLQALKRQKKVASFLTMQEKLC